MKMLVEEFPDKFIITEDRNNFDYVYRIDELTKLAEGQMRRSLEMWNKDSLNDKKIRKDFDQYTNRNK